MDITSKTWRSGGVDIRSGDNSDAEEAAVGTAPLNGGTYHTQGTTTSTGSQGSAVNNAPGTYVGGKYTSQAVQNLLSHIASMGTQSLSAFTNKQTNLFSIQFLGFDSYAAVSSTGYRNSEIMDEQTIAVTSLHRTKTGWSTVDFAVMDDTGNDVLKILNQQMQYQTSGNVAFDVVLEYYDDQGNTTASTTLHDCTVEEFSCDPLNATTSGKVEMKVIMTVQPQYITFC